MSSEPSSHALPLGGWPADGHVHSQFSYDATRGDMEATCARAVALGVPAVAFTEHADLTPWTVTPEEIPYVPEPLRAQVPPGGGIFRAPALDLDGYLAAVERCRDRFPQLRILSGVELGEPHRHADAYADLVARGGLERVLGSLHSIEARGGFTEVHAVLREEPDRYDAVRRYLAELEELAASTAGYELLAHVDYVARYWDGEQLAFGRLEEEYRAVFRALAASGRALEVNTRLPLPVEVLRWWADCGGTTVTFGSDAHQPQDVARGFVAASAMVEAAGFRPGRDPWEPWSRARVAATGR